MTSSHDATIWTAPSELRRRRDETGVRRMTPKKLRPLKITPDVDALGYDPFENQPTLVHAQSWRSPKLLTKSPAKPPPLPLLLEKKKKSWLDSLPEAARAVLMAAAQPVASGAPRIAGAIAQPHQP